LPYWDRRCRHLAARWTWLLWVRVHGPSICPQIASAVAHWGPDPDSHPFQCVTLTLV
jgi:hypothetical protein